jgi:hypothetical protein
MASVLSFIGQPLHAKSLFMAFTNDTTARGTHPEIINSVRDKVTTGSGKCGSLIETLICWNRPSRQSGTGTRLLKIAALCCGCCVHPIIQHPIVWEWSVSGYLTPTSPKHYLWFGKLWTGAAGQTMWTESMGWVLAADTNVYNEATYFGDGQKVTTRKGNGMTTRTGNGKVIRTSKTKGRHIH